MGYMILFASNQAFISNKISNFVNMKRPFNTHIEDIDLKFWHDLIESHGKLVTLNAGDYICHAGEPSCLLYTSPSPRDP